ncbi:kinase-like protein [Cadophora sp. DSE1049]|nr:kinase-like protein [Cadophora sp. DSE1049]
MASSLRTGVYLTPLQQHSVEDIVHSEDEGPGTGNGTSLPRVAPSLDAVDGNHIIALDETDGFQQHSPTSIDQDPNLHSSVSGDVRRSASVVLGNVFQPPNRLIPIEHVLANDYDFPEQLGSLSIEEKEILEVGSGEGSWGVFRCEHPSCWDVRDKFRFSVFTDLAHHYKHSHPANIEAEMIPCSYDSCKRSDDPFTRKDAYRDHLREYHLEDMLKRHKKKNREQEWWASRIVSPVWWRCVRCLGPSIIVQRDGWTCKTCNQECEPERIHVRKSIATNTFPKGGGLSEKFGIVSPRQYADGSTKWVASAAARSEDGASSSSTVKQKIPVEETYSRDSSTSQTTQSDPGHSEHSKAVPEPPNMPGFGHFEYASHKVVPFTTVKQLGHGSLGSVDAVRHSGDADGVILARKVIRLPNIARKRLLPLIQQEVSVLRELRHKHIIQVISTYETISAPRQFGILLSPAGDEDLSHYLERVCEDDFPEDDLQRLEKWQYCLASAVAYIHSRNVRHKDIKPSNAICKGGDIFLTDFGSAHQFSAGLTSSTEGYAAGITKMYSAPEVISLDRRGRPADIYSLGCVFAEMATVVGRRAIEDFHEFRSEPIPDEPDRLTLCYYATAHKLGDWFESDAESWSYSLIAKMLAEDQALRPSAEKVLSILVEHSRYSDCSCRFVSDREFNPR